MKEYTYFLVIFLLFLTACKQNAVTKTHGIAYLEKREKLIVVNKSNILGMQFHPEKSAKVGLELLENIIKQF